MKKKQEYKLQYGIAVFEGKEKVDELTFKTEDEMWTALKKLEEKNNSV